MKVSLTFTLIEQAPLSIIQETFVDSVTFTAHTCDVKSKQRYIVY